MSADTFVGVPGASTQSPIELSPLDQLAASLLVRILWCFEITPTFDKKALSLSLEQGLGRCLQDLPFYAARIVRDPKSGRASAFTDSGVHLHFRDYSSRELSEQWTAGSYQYLKEENFPISRLKPVYHLLTSKNMMAEENDSVLDIQVSFVEGGVFIVIAYHHGYMGAPGLDIFLERWARYTAATPGLVEPDPLPQLSPQANNRQLLPRAKDSTRLPAILRWKGKPTGLIIQREPPVLATSIWRLTCENAKKLKEAASSTTGGGLSLNDALSALLWRHIVRARNLDHSQFEISKWTTTCDAKSRVQPPLPLDFIGNSAVHAVATAKTSHLVSSMCANNLPYLANLIRASISAVDHESVSQDVAALGALKSMSDIEWAVSSGCDAGISNWVRFNYIGREWGDGIRCNALRVMDGHEGVSNLTAPAGNEGSIEISTTLPEEVVQILRLDKEFTQFVRFLCV